MPVSFFFETYNETYNKYNNLYNIFITHNYAPFLLCRKKKLVKRLIKINGALSVN